MENKKSWINRHPVLSISVLVILLVLSINMTKDIDTSPQTETPVAQKSVSTGSEGYLRIDGEGQIVVAATEESLDALIKASVANDSLGITELLLNGRAFMVPNGTKVLVLDTGFTKDKVRILEGENIAKTGYVPFEFVKSQ